MSEISDKRSIKRTEARVSSKHDVSMHNAIVKLMLTPVEHVAGRKAVEDSIFHLYSVHRVAVTKKLREKLIAANPSEDLLSKLFEFSPIEVMHPGIANLAESSVVRGAYF